MQASLCQAIGAADWLIAAPVRSVRGKKRMGAQRTHTAWRHSRGTQSDLHVYCCLSLLAGAVAGVQRAGGNNKLAQRCWLSLLT